MVLEVFLRLACVCLLLCSSGFGYPFQTKGTGGGAIQGGTSATGTYPSGHGPGYYYGFSHTPGGGARPGSGAGGTGSALGGASSGGAGGSGSRTSGAGSGLRSARFGFPVFQGFPWGHKFVVPPSFFNMNQVRLPRFPFGNPWDTNSVPLGSVVVRPPPPMSHIVQTSNGYQRARSVLAHSKYSPHEWSVLPLRSGQVRDGGQVKGWTKNVL